MSKVPRPGSWPKTFPDDLADQVMAVFEAQHGSYYDKLTVVLTEGGEARLTKRRLATAEEFSLTVEGGVWITRCFDLEESGRHVAALCRYLVDLAKTAGDAPPFEGVEEV
jgi:hypothetical protein